MITKGSISSEDSAIRYRASTSDGAVFTRIKMAEVDMHTTPTRGISFFK